LSYFGLMYTCRPQQAYQALAHKLAETSLVQTPLLC
jgi:hypothetical protein